MVNVLITSLLVSSFTLCFAFICWFCFWLRWQRRISSKASSVSACLCQGPSNYLSWLSSKKKKKIHSIHKISFTLNTTGCKHFHCFSNLLLNNLNFNGFSIWTYSKSNKNVCVKWRKHMKYFKKCVKLNIGACICIHPLRLKATL